MRVVRSLPACAWLLAALLGSTGAAACSGAQDDVETLQRQALAAAERGQSEEAVRLFSQVLERAPQMATAWYWRGREHFRLGQIEESARDFDKYVELRPDQASRQWERGITLYYAGRFEDGARQFADYQSYHANDVENSAWRYLCVARTAGVEEARRTVLPIEHDPRVPMMEVYQLYRGELKPEEVLAAARAGSPAKEQLEGRLFYAHLYLGLWFEAAGQEEQAARYLRLAAACPPDNRHVNGYMADVARVHVDRLNEAAKENAEQDHGPAVPRK